MTTRRSVLSVILAALCMSGAPAAAQDVSIPQEGIGGTLPPGFPRLELLAAASTPQIRSYVTALAGREIRVMVSGPIGACGANDQAGRAQQLEILSMGQAQRATPPAKVDTLDDATHLVREARFATVMRGKPARALLRGYVSRTCASRVVGITVLDPNGGDPAEDAAIRAFVAAARPGAAPATLQPAEVGRPFRTGVVQVVLPPGMLLPDTLPDAGENERQFGTGDRTSVVMISITEDTSARARSMPAAVRRRGLDAYQRSILGQARDVRAERERRVGPVLVRDIRYSQPRPNGVTMEGRVRLLGWVTGPVRIVALIYARGDGQPMDEARANAFFNSLRIVDEPTP